MTNYKFQISSFGVPLGRDVGFSFGLVMCGGFRYRGWASFFEEPDFFRIFSAVWPNVFWVFVGRKCAEFAVVILLPVLQAMALAIVTPTRKPVKEPGPLTTKTFLISFQCFLFFFKSAARFGKIFCASSRLLGQDFSAKSCGVAPASKISATAVSAPDEFMAMVNMQAEYMLTARWRK